MVELQHLYPLEEVVEVCNLPHRNNEHDEDAEQAVHHHAAVRFL